jgi:iron complex outermembrane receptor protein
LLPNLRLSWNVSPHHMVWTSASRTVRAPSRLDRDPFIPGKPPFLLRGGPDTRSEVARVYEIGYRGQAERVTGSVAVYHADYDRMHTQEISASRTFVVFSDAMRAAVTGIEAWASWQVSPQWRLSGGYTGLRQRFTLEPWSNDTPAPALAARDPANTWLVRASFTPAPRVSVDALLRGSSALDDPPVSRYATADLRAAWEASPGVSLFVIAQNLGGSHAEANPAAFRAELDRSFFLGLRWEFGAR